MDRAKEASNQAAREGPFVSGKDAKGRAEIRVLGDPSSSLAADPYPASLENFRYDPRPKPEASSVVLGRGCKATWKREFKLPWREAGPPNHHDDKVDSDQ